MRCCKPGCGNDGPVEITERFPQDLGNLGRPRFPHSHSPFFFISLNDDRTDHVQRKPDILTYYEQILPHS